MAAVLRKKTGASSLSTLLVVICAMGGISTTAFAQTISTFAGTGEPATSGDAGQAALAGIHRPEALEYDLAGNLYVSEVFGQRVRKVTPDGLITTLAGNGNIGFGGDGGPAVDATFYYTGDVAVDRQGNVYVTDQINARIRKITPDGKIETIAGNGQVSYSPDGPVANRPLVWPYALAVADDGTLYFSELGYQGSDSWVRKLTPDGQMVTVAGRYQAAGFDPPELSGIVGLEFDGQGRLLIVDGGTSRVLRLEGDGSLSRLAGGGSAPTSDVDEIPGVDARLNYPNDLAVAADGTLYIADRNRVRRLSPDGMIHAFAGVADETAYGFEGDGGPALNATFSYTHGVTVDPRGNVLISDALNHRIRRVVPFATCAAEQYRGEQLALCRQICEADHSPQSEMSLIRVYVAKFHEPPACAR